MGKVRISATIDESLNDKLDVFLEKSKFKNKSHVIEEAILEFLNKEVKNVKK